jgi:hypothetical protein
VSDDLWYLLYGAYRQTHVDRESNLPRIIKPEYRLGDDGFFHGVLNSYRLVTGRGLHDIMTELSDGLFEEIAMALENTL